MTEPPEVIERIRDWLIDTAVEDPHPGAIFSESTHDKERSFVNYGQLRKLLMMVFSKGGGMRYVDFIEKYGAKKVVFESYYKYDFCFKAKDEKFLVMVGGDASDIYRVRVDAGVEYSVYELEPNAANIDGNFIYF